MPKSADFACAPRQILPAIPWTSAALCAAAAFANSEKAYRYLDPAPRTGFGL